MKILEINAFHYLKGGSETVYFNTAALLRSHGHEVVDFALKWPGNEPSAQSGFFAESKESRRGPLRSVKNIVNYFYHFEAASNLDKLIEKERPDIAQVHLVWGQHTPSILKVLRRRGIPVVLTIHDFRIVCPASVMRNGRGLVCEQCESGHFYKCVANTCCKGSRGLSLMMAAEAYFRNAFFNPASLVDGLLYVSDFSRAKHEQYMPALKTLPAERIYNVSQHLRDVPAKAAEPAYYLYFGRLSGEKGVRTLVDAMSQLPDVSLKIAGTGPEDEALRSEVAARGLNNVEFLGYKSGEELRSLVAGARFVIVPSECYENNPLTIVEAYSEGTPVIGSEIGGIPEILIPGVTGFRFKPGDTDSLVDAVKKSLELSPDAYGAMRRGALDFARRNFSATDYYPRLMNLFAKVAPDIFKNQS